MAVEVQSATQERAHFNSKTQAEDPLATICCEGQQTYSERRDQVLRTGVFSRYSEIMETSTSFLTNLSGERTRSQALPLSGWEV